MIEKKAVKFLQSVPKRDYIKLREHISHLAINPHPAGSIKLSGTENEFRYRYGNYRILYTVEHNILTVFIIDIGNRKDIYR